MEQYTIKMENFEGPLDLLCHLIDKNKMDICDIKICDITDQYLNYLKEMQQMNLDVTSEFIVMASKLVYLKSKSLLPTIIQEDEEEIDLVQMLIEYKKYKEFTSVLKERIELYGGKFFKVPDKVELPKGKLEKSFGQDVIPKIYNDFVTKEMKKKNIYANNIDRLATSEKFTVRSKIKEILKELWKKPTFIFNKLFSIKKRSKIEVVTAFSSLLERAKMSNGLALSGGGLKIFAHMGVLKALEELSIKFDYVTGTSSGSVVAVLYSLGVKPRDMMKMISNKYSGLVKIRTNKVFRSAFKSLLNNDLTLNSLIDGARMEDLISGVLDGKSMMGDIDKNLAIVSCDTISTKEVVFMAKDFKFKNTNRTDYLLNAPIAKAVRASMSFPGVFTACDYEGYNLIDGGTVNNLPSKLLKDMGADKVLGASFKLNDYKPKDSIMDVALRTADIFSILNMSIAKQFVDISIELDIPDAGLLNVDNVNEVYNLGYSQTMQRREEILKIFK